MDKQALIQQLITQIGTLPHRDSVALDALKKKSEMYIRNIFGESSKYLIDLKRINFRPMIYPADENYYNESWHSGISELKNLYQTMSDELSIFGSKSSIPDEKQKSQKIDPPAHLGSKVFIVHGHSEGIKSEAARLLEKLGLEPIILHEKPNSGKTIIEKFESESADVSVAIVLLTGDDEGHEIGSSDELKARARQNVIFEFGYFIGIMGRSKVVALVEEGVEIPSDYSGVIYLSLDNSGAWKLLLAKELKNMGISLDMNLV